MVLAQILLLLRVRNLPLSLILPPPEADREADVQRLHKVPMFGRDVKHFSRVHYTVLEGQLGELWPFLIFILQVNLLRQIIRFVRRLLYSPEPLLMHASAHS